MNKHKRGKDIKTFEDLPEDVQRAVAKQRVLLSDSAVCSSVVTGKPKCPGCMLDSLTKKHDKDCTASPENQRKLEACNSNDDHSTGVAV